MINLIDLTNKEVFPNTKYRFSKVIQETEDSITLERDFIGENPFHYYLNAKTQEAIVANSIREIKSYLQEKGSKFLWEHIRAVSNNKKVTITSDTFYNARPETAELGTTLQELQQPPVDLSNTSKAGEYIRGLFVQSIDDRLETIHDEVVGLLLSGGLDSITTGYYLKSNLNDKKLRAFTLKVNEDEADISKSREVVKQLGVPLTEVKISRNSDDISVGVQSYDLEGNLEKEYSVSTENINEIVKKTLAIAENPKRDNLFCSLAMYLIGQAIKSEGIKTVFCGEGPNEMINDYGFQPPKEGYPGMGVSSTYFRQALTFGLKESDLQLGRGGLGKHALSRMGKMFAFYGIRLESPFFNRDIANALTRIPYEDADYSVIKPKIDESILGEDGRLVLGALEGISKEKFQDGSGISKVFVDFSQEQLIETFKQIYGVNKESYVKN
ncbi:MAG: asparagine synthase-related protein [Patescibacteria group bacterium]